MSTLILQSHTNPLPYDWLKVCMHSVQAWSADNNFKYRFWDDSIFDLVPQSILGRFGSRKVILSDLARLKAIRSLICEGHDRVVWLDADMLVFRPEQFKLPATSELPERYMLGREVWVQPRVDNPQKLQAYKKVHNAFLLFDRHNSFLDFYIEQAERMLLGAELMVPDQFIGPKLLTALHNIIQCPVMETAGMLSPEVIRNLLSGGQSACALNLLVKRSAAPLMAANLCGSSVASGAITSEQMELVCEILLRQSVCL